MGEAWPTVEHFYQAQKCFDPRYIRAIRTCTTPGQARPSAVSPHQTATSWFVWTDLATRLLATGDAEIVEDARHDAFWGTGPGRRTGPLRLRSKNEELLTPVDEFIGQASTVPHWYSDLAIDVNRRSAAWRSDKDRYWASAAASS